MADGCFITVINPSQIGKSTLMAALEEELETKYMVINISLHNITSGSLFQNFVSDLQVRNIDKYFGGKTFLIVDEIQEIKNASEDDVQSWRSCKERRDFQALQSSIIVSNYLGAYLHTHVGSCFSQTDRFVAEYFSI